MVYVACQNFFREVKVRVGLKKTENRQPSKWEWKPVYSKHYTVLLNATLVNMLLVHPNYVRKFNLYLTENICTLITKKAVHRWVWK